MRIRSYFTALLALLLSIFTVRSAGPSGRIVAAIEPFIAQNEISGAVTLVAERGEIVSFDATGLADIQENTAMKKDSLFWIASMTKPFTGVAIMMLLDEGKLSIDDPVENHLPEFANLYVVSDQTDDSISLRRPARKITLKDLLTHTAGVQNVDAPRPDSTLAEVVAMSSQRPLQFEPGSKWSYSNAGIDTLGRIVEVVSGQSFDHFLQVRILEPLGMKNTTFHPNKRLSKRLARTYTKNMETGALEETDIHFIKSELWDESRTVRPAGGLFATAEDLFKFYQMMLNGGTWKGKQLLSESAIQELTRTQTGDIKTGFTAGMNWGLGFQVVKEPQGVTEMLSPGTFGHGGAYATQSWADPERQTVYILMVQRRGFPNGDDSEVRKAFQAAAVEMLNHNLHPSDLE